MSDVRVNGKRVPPLQTIDTLETLVGRLDALGRKENTVITALNVNGSAIDIDNPEFFRMRLEADDKIDVRMETAEQLSFESLTMAQDMANLLVFDIKVTTLALWDNTKTVTKSLETLLGDCKLFLSLGAKPVYLLNKEPTELDTSAQNCLRQLDHIADHLEDAVLLTVNSHLKEAAHILVARVLPTIEKWLGFSAEFAQLLEINNISSRVDINQSFQQSVENS